MPDLQLDINDVIAEYAKVNTDLTTQLVIERAKNTRLNTIVGAQQRKITELETAAREERFGLEVSEAVKADEVPDFD